MEMAYCAPLGIPHSQLLKWDREDVDKAISYTAWKGKFCQKCGTDPAEWLDENGEAVEPPPYVAVTHICLGCATLEEQRETVPKDVASHMNTFLKRTKPEEFKSWQMKQRASS